MQLSVIGLNHNTASVSVRECMAVNEAQMREVYAALLSDPRVSEAMILSTCNRVEYYLLTRKAHEEAEILYILATSINAGALSLRKHTYIHTGTNAANHMVLVASGIDSLVLGEPQIFGQVKTAFRLSKEHGGFGSYLNRLEQFVLNTTKKVRTNTGIAGNAVSVSYAAVALAKKIFGSLETKNALIIGAGEMCELAAEHLEGAQIGSITVTNRTFSRAENLARKFRGRAVEFDKFAAVLKDMDIIISSTGAPTAVVSAAMVKEAVKTRKMKPMFFIDIAVPRDIEQEVGQLENVYLYDIDNLKQVIEANKRERENEAVKARELIAGAVAHFERSTHALGANPVIVALRKHTGEILKGCLEQYCKKNKLDAESSKKLEQLTAAIEGKLLHVPAKNLKAYFSGDQLYSLEEACELLFNLKKE